MGVHEAGKKGAAREDPDRIAGVPGPQLRGGPHLHDLSLGDPDTGVGQRRRAHRDHQIGEKKHVTSRVGYMP